jgi:nucleotide-binding universal stress UspA family protein
MPEARPYRRVLALIRFDASDDLVAGKALALARLNRAQLDFLHLIEPDAPLDGGYAGSPTATAHALEQAALRRLQFVAARAGAAEARCHAAYGPPRQGFSRHILASPAELVVTTEPSPYLAGTHDLLVLARDKSRRAKGMLNMLMNLVWPARGLARV